MSVDPYDEPAILDSDVIIRRINPVYHVVWDENRQKRRITTLAYNKSSGLREGMSVDLEALMVAAEINPREFVTTPVFTASVALGASSIRVTDLQIGYDPVTASSVAPGNPYHGQVWHKQERRSFTDAQKRHLANNASWYVELPDVDLV